MDFVETPSQMFEEWCYCLNSIKRLVIPELKGKLAFIDADIFRLEQNHSVDPDNIVIRPVPSADPTTIESQSLTVLRNMLSVTIADAESAITNLYTGQEYASIKSATIPNELTDNKQEVSYHYMHLLNVFQQLFDKVKSELDNFVIGIFSAGDAMNNCKNNLIWRSEALVHFKSELADLLNDEGTESEINAKEQQIEDLKEIMLSKATELKQIEIEINSGMSNQKLVKLKRYATDLQSAAEESRYYRMANHDFLKHEFPFTELDIAYRSFELYSGVFEFMDSGYTNQSTIKLFQNGQMSEFKLLKQKITQDKDYYRNSQKENNHQHDDTYALNQPQQLFDCDERNNGNGTEYYNITDFLPNAPQETKDFYVTYSRQLHNATSGYINEKTRYDLYRGHISNHVNYFSSIIDEQFNNISALRTIKIEKLYAQESHFGNSNGHYEGTPEQDSLLSSTKGIWIQAEAEYLSQTWLNKSKMKTFELYNTIFPEFYSTLSTLESNLDNMPSLDFQALTVSEAEYVAAFVDHKSKVASFESIYAEWLNGPGGLSGENFLQTTLGGEAADLRDDAYTLLQDLQNSTDDAYNDWAIINGEEITGLTTLFIGKVAAYFSFNSAADELNQLLSSNYGSDIGLSESGHVLKGFKDNRVLFEDGFHNAQVARDTAYNAYSEAKTQMTFVESTPQEKREGMRSDHDLYKVYKQENRLTSLVDRYSELLPALVSQMGSFVNEVRRINGEDNGESYFDLSLIHI